MAGTSTITALTAGNVTRLTGAAVLVADDSTATTVKYTAAQLRTVLFAGTAGGYTSSDPLNVGALAASTGTFSGAVSGTTGTFSGAVSGTTGTFSSTLAVTGLATLSGDVNINTTTAATLNFYGSTGVYGIRVTSASGVMDLRTNSVTGLSIANSGAGVTVPGNVTVTGSATLNGGLVVTGGLTSSVGLTVGANALITNTASGYLIVGANGGGLYLRSGTVAGAIYMQDSAGNAAPVNVSGAITSNGVISTQRGTGQAINLYSASSLGHQWDIYGSGNNLRFSDNTGGGTFAVDTAATVGGTLNVTGAATLSSNTSLKTYTEATATPAISAGALTLDLNTGNTFRVALSANVTTLTISNPTASVTQSFTLICDISGAFSVTWPASVRWAGGTAPTQTATNAKTDIFTFVSTDGGTKWFAFPSGLSFTT